MIIVLTGNGKGKTTSSIGQIVRALGHNQKVCLIQLFKGENFYGEQKILSSLDNLDFFSYAKKHPFCCKDVTKEQISSECERALDKIKKIIADNKYDLIVLEEFNIAVRDGYINISSLLEAAKKLSEKSTVFITGRQAHEDLIAAADLVSEVKEIKHPYNEGVSAKEGIEF
ncbi:MAG: cob(I)yrinic acid a,c-diamide adenosyltransferase [Endomicrobiaceae bacterium]|jgi:cob(I)alamin adenosyltransferase|nr:cob(I)yrinic acid a,c-diamide adenosyltransferase [Endomicrobiaceae bacterium]